MGHIPRPCITQTREPCRLWAPVFFRQWMGPLEAYAAPMPPQAPRTHGGKVIAPRGGDAPGLF